MGCNVVRFVFIPNTSNSTPDTYRGDLILKRKYSQNNILHNKSFYSKILHNNDTTQIGYCKVLCTTWEHIVQDCIVLKTFINQ